MILEVFGKAAHSGVNFYDGCSAIDELALKITKLSKLTNLKTGATVNVGLVRGGQTVNTVAPYAAGEIDLRYVTPSDRETVLNEIASIASQCSLPGTSGVLKIKGEFLPLNPTQSSHRLLEIYQAAAANLDLKIEGEFTGGCADSGFAAAQGAPTLCGLGPVGGKAHSPEEYMEVELARASCTSAGAFNSASGWAPKPMNNTHISHRVAGSAIGRIAAECAPNLWDI